MYYSVLFSVVSVTSECYFAAATWDCFGNPTVIVRSVRCHHDSVWGSFSELVLLTTGTEIQFKRIGEDRSRLYESQVDVTYITILLVGMAIGKG